MERKNRTINKDSPLSKLSKIDPRHCINAGLGFFIAEGNAPADPIRPGVWSSRLRVGVYSEKTNVRNRNDRQNQRRTY